MIKKVFIPSLVLLGLVLIVGSLSSLSPSYAQDGGDAEHDEQAVLRGAVLYAEFCGACHGATGEAIASGAAFVDITNFNPQTAKTRIADGYDANPADSVKMIGFGEASEGPLSDSQIDDILAYMNTWASGDSPALPEPHLEPGNLDAGSVGNAEHGAEIYASFCLTCHGLEAQGRGLANFPAFEINENSIRILERSQTHGSVAAFSSDLGGPLTRDDLNDLDAYLRTIDVEKDEEQAKGVGILLIVIGLAAVGGVGSLYLASQRPNKDKNA